MTTLSGGRAAGYMGVGNTPDRDTLGFSHSIDRVTEGRISSLWRRWSMVGAAAAACSLHIPASQGSHTIVTIAAWALGLLPR